MNDELAEVGKFTSEQDAQMARQALTDEGIDAMIMKDDAGGMLPQFQMVEGVRLLVRTADQARAREILKAIER